MVKKDKNNQKMKLKLNNNGFIYVTKYSEKFRKLIIGIAEKSALTSLGKKSLSNIGIFLFGSPSRQEMIDESDADIMIIRKNDNEEYLKFREEFIKNLEKEKFPKIDVPMWGNLTECKNYLECSIIEGNQVIEAKFIYGDETIVYELSQMRKKFCTKDKFERIILFQKLYFDQYYKQRTIKGIKNVKYGHGGTRDFMFLTWFCNLIDISEGKRINFEDKIPYVYKSLGDIYSRKIIKFEEYKKFLKSIETVLILRNKILIQNRGTKNEGLTYLDEGTMKKLFTKKLFNESNIKSHNDLKIVLENDLENVKQLKLYLWNLFIEYLKKEKGLIWQRNFKKILMGEFDKHLISNIAQNDILSRTAVIWNFDKLKDVKLFNNVFVEFSKCNQWEVLASICCHAKCPSKVLDDITKRIGKKRGYEYILKIIARNKNTNRESLKRIINNPNLEERFRIVAEIAYNKGVKKANELR